MKQKIKNNIFTYLIVLLDHTYPCITTLFITLVLSPLYTQTAYTPDYIESKHASDSAKKATTEKLLCAAETGNSKLAYEAIRKQVNINTKSSDGRAALVEAAANGHINIVHLLLKHTANINIQNIHGNTALIQASSFNNTDMVRLLLEHNADTNIQNNFSNTALIQASSTDNTDIIHLLLEYNAQVNIRNMRGSTALIVSVLFNKHSITETLILHGADASIANYKQQTALHTAAPELQDIITSAIEKRVALEHELGQQNWDLETSSPFFLLEQCMIPHVASLVCAYANPYNDTFEPFLLHAIKQYIQDKKALSRAPAASTHDICCALYPECNCSKNSNIIETNNKCVHCTIQ